MMDNNTTKKIANTNKPKTRTTNTNKQSSVLEVGIDVGFGNVKIYTKHKGKEIKITFPSRFKKIDYETTDSIEINEDKYTFVEGDYIIENGHTSKDNKDTRVLLWKALNDISLETNITEFNICMNAALDSYKADNGRSIQDTMTEFKTIKIKERFKNEREIKINNLVCFPECLVGGATVKKEQLNLREEEVIIIDFGNLNMQGIHVLYGSPNYKKSFATDYGMHHIYRRLAEQIKLVEPGIATGAAVELYLKKTKEDSKYIISEVDDVIMDFLIGSIFKELDIELNMIKPSMYCKYLLTGGGSERMQRFLETKFVEDKEKIFLEDGYYANAKGLYGKAKRIFNEKEGAK